MPESMASGADFLKQELLKHIQVLGLEGQAICIHSSLRSASPRISANDLIDTFLLAGCTMLVPTFTYFYDSSPGNEDKPARNGIDYSNNTQSVVARTNVEIYNNTNNELSLQEMGGFNAAILSRPDRIRGNHSLNSFTALGRLAHQLIDDQGPEDVYAPLRKLTELSGRLLLMGTDLTSLTFIHYAEQISGRKLFIRWALGEDGRTCRFRVGSCSRGFNNLQATVANITDKSSLNGSTWQVLRANEALDQISTKVHLTPTITQCDDINCLRCIDAVAGGPLE